MGGKWFLQALLLVASTAFLDAATCSGAEYDLMNKESMDDGGGVWCDQDLPSDATLGYATDAGSSATCQTVCTEHDPPCLAVGHNPNGYCKLFSAQGTCHDTPASNPPWLWWKRRCDAHCTCSGGIAATRGECKTSGETCVQCYPCCYLSGGRCWNKQCLCANGQASTGKACPQNGVAHCSSCDDGFTLIKAMGTCVTSTPTPTPTSTATSTQNPTESPTQTLTTTPTTDPFVCNHTCAVNVTLACPLNDQYVCTNNADTILLCELQQLQSKAELGLLDSATQATQKTYMGTINTYPITWGWCDVQDQLKIIQERLDKSYGDLTIESIPGKTIALVQNTALGKAISLPLDQERGAVDEVQIKNFGSAKKAVVSVSNSSDQIRLNDLNKELPKLTQIQFKSAIVQINRFTNDVQPLNVAEDSFDLDLKVNATPGQPPAGILLMTVDENGLPTFEDAERKGASVTTTTPGTYNVTLSGALGSQTILFAYQKSCEDGVLNQDEMTLDCGGVCGVCGFDWKSPYFLGPILLVVLLSVFFAAFVLAKNMTRQSKPPQKASEALGYLLQHTERRDVDVGIYVME